MSSENEKNVANDTKSHDSIETAQNPLAAAAPVEVVVLDSDDGGESHVDSGGSYFCRTVYRPIPPFLLKVHDMLENPETNNVISWTCGGSSFVITNPHTFAKDVLPMYFRHNNFQSFVAQLNTYGFRKVSWEHWEYSNKNFRKGERHLLNNIRRRNQISHNHHNPYAHENSPSTGRNIEKELEALTKEHELLKVEFEKLKDKQEALEKKLATLMKSRAVVKGGKGGIKEKEEGVLGKKKKVEENSEGSKMPMLDEGESGKGYEKNTLISLEDVFGEPTTDWAEYCKELMEKAGHHFKS
ncbi:heat shock transcription factor family protein [Striga asiatica]|uniref:Heat shock transcription factor family protein n=1 Tax=Striga asiatica TaxID=4170 RepID=A0A5A7R8Y2_STRAF|nr:heat shock transcription factor family protein [Striga asiatica]